MAADTPTSGVIHDIGFRHYDGPRLGRGWIVRSLLVETLRGVFGLGRPARVKTMPWLLVGFSSLPALIMVIVTILTKLKSLPVSYVGYPAVVQFLVILFVAGRAPYAVSRDLRDGVMPLYFSRPMKRQDYVFAKFGGLAIGMLALVMVPETVLFVGALLAKLPVGDQIRGFVAGIVVSTLLALVLAAIGLIIAAITPRRGQGVAAIITTLIVVQGLAAILNGITSAMGHEILGAYLAALDPFGLVNAIAGPLLAGLLRDHTTYPVGAGGAWLLLVGLLALVTGCIAGLMARYRKVGGV